MSVLPFEIVKKDLESCEEILLSATKISDEFVENIAQHLLKSGGKRLRPALCILSARAGKKFDLEKTLPIAAALELIHTASLVHDDVIDESQLRRGRKTTNALFGNQSAILSGDFLFARAFKLISARDYGTRVSMKLAELVEDLSVGEITQDRFEFQIVDESKYLERIEKKTAGFLSTACELGAIVSEMDEIDLQKLSSYGKFIGLAFQITDDILDIIGDEKNLGKKAGADLKQGIITLPVIYALEKDSGRLQQLVTNPNMTDEDIFEAIEMIKSTDAIDRSKNLADDYLDRAKKILPDDIQPEIFETFVSAADFIGKRNF